MNTGANITTDGRTFNATGMDLVANGGAANIALVNRGAISTSTTAEGSVAIFGRLANSTGTIDITNSGVLSATSGGSGERDAAVAGISALGDAGGRAITVTNSGAITIRPSANSFDTDFAGIASAIVTNAFAPTSETLITNTAILTGIGPNASGITGFADNSNAADPSNITIRNSGAINLSNGFDAYGIFAQAGGRIGVGQAADTVIENSAAITVTGARNLSGTESYQFIGSINAVQNSKVSITNNGILTGAGDAQVVMLGIGVAGGFQIGTGNGATYDWTVNNTGDMNFGTSWARGITMAGTRGDTITASITNSGDFDFRTTTNSASQGIRADFGFLDSDETSGGSSQLNITNSGNVAMGAGSALIATATKTIITNSGALSTTADGAHVVTITGSGPAGAGTVTQPGSTLNFTNSGNIAAVGAGADAIRIANVDQVTLAIAAGTTVSAGTGAASRGLAISGDPSAIDLAVAGTIASADGVGIQVDGDGLFELDVAASGRVQGGEVAIQSSARTVINVANGGQIDGDVITGDLADTITGDLFFTVSTSGNISIVDGTFLGKISTGGGNDLVDLRSPIGGGAFSGVTVDLGAGDDELRLTKVFLPVFGEVEGGAGYDILSLRFPSTDSIGGPVDSATLSGFEELKLNGGTFTFSGENANLIPLIRLESGSFLQFANLGNTDLIAASGTTLTLAGRVGDLTVGGNMALGGTAPSTQAIGGDLTLQAGSVYTVRIRPDGTSDRIDAAGRVILQGGALFVQKAEGVYTPGARFTLLNAAGGVSGTFGSLDQNMPFVDLNLVYDANNVFLDVTRNTISFCTPGATANQCATGNGLDSVGDGTVYDAVASLPSEAAAEAAFASLSGEIYASARGAIERDSRLPRHAVLSRLATAGEGSGAWGQVFGNWGQTDGDGNAYAMARDTKGLLMGADFTVGSNWRFGLAGGYTNSDLTIGALASRGDLKGIHALVYAGGAYGPIRIRAGFGYADMDLDTTRNVAFPGFSNSLRGQADGSLLQGFTEIGYAFAMGGGEIEPFAGFTTVRTKLGNVTETGGTAALSGQKGSETFSASSLGLRGNLALGKDLRIQGSAAWRHGFGSLRSTTSLSFAGGDSFMLSGTSLNRDEAVFEVGLMWRIAPSVSLGVRYDGTLGSRSTDHSAQGVLSWRF